MSLLVGGWCVPWTWVEKGKRKKIPVTVKLYGINTPHFFFYCQVSNLYIYFWVALLAQLVRASHS